MEYKPNAQHIATATTTAALNHVRNTHRLRQDPIFGCQRFPPGCLLNIVFCMLEGALVQILSEVWRKRAKAQPLRRSYKISEKARLAVRLSLGLKPCSRALPFARGAALVWARCWPSTALRGSRCSDNAAPFIRTPSPSTIFGIITASASDSQWLV
jgi:hypothetical protein